MAKENERNLAEYYYLERNFTAREIAAKLNVTEATVSKWVNLYGWRERRDARATSATSRIDNMQQIISDFARQRIELSRQLESCTDDKEREAVRINISNIDAGVAKWNKALENANKSVKVSLSVQVDMFENIFDALRAFNEKVYLQTLPFQEYYITKISQQK